MELDKLVIIIGPSAVGKTTIARGLETSNLGIQKVITTTTRPIRENEVDGSDYHFLSREDFQALIAQEALIEWAEYNGNYYGSTLQDVEKIVAAGKIPLWVAENKGAEFLKGRYPRAIVIFIMPADFESLRRRLEKRHLPKEEIVSRLKIARQELLFAPKADYRVVNYDGRIELVVAETVELIRHHYHLD